MKIGSLNWKWVIPSLIVSFSARADVLSNAVISAQNSLEKTRLELRNQGFKTELTNFDFSTSPELRARENILAAAAPARKIAVALSDYPDQMEAAVSNKAVVVWRQGFLVRQPSTWPDGKHKLSWDDFSDAINQNQSQLDAACTAIMAGPISFNLIASRGNRMVLPHLSILRGLTEFLDDRIMLALHGGNRKAAWTNLMAATRLATEWNPEPVEISHRTRFNDVDLVFKATWQALQTNGWTDDQLEGLQREWETADLLGHLPDIQEFRCASDLNALESDKPTAQTPESGTYEDEQRLLLFYRDREADCRNALQAGTWSEMRSMPGVTNEIYFEPKYHYRMFGMSLVQRRMSARFAGQGKSFLAQAAQAETERRILVTALALERYHAKNNRYPESLPMLSPQFVKSVPADFMTGQSLHYCPTPDGRFLLYSVGLDRADNGGRIEIPPTVEERFARLENPNILAAQSDIVWPLAATSPEVAALRKRQAQSEARLVAQRKAEAEQQEKTDAQQQRELRAAAMKKLLARQPSLGPEPVYQGVPLSSWVDKIGQIERYNGTPPDAVAAIRAIGPKVVPFLLEWMPHPGAEKPVEGYPEWDGIEFAWWALGTEGKSAIPELARNLARPEHGMDDYSVWTESAKAISYLGPDAIAPMLTVATNMQGKHEMWELLNNLGNLGTNGAPAVPALIHWANDPDYWVRDGVVSALGGIGKQPDLAVPVLINALRHDANGMVRRDAAGALGAFANDSDAVLPELTTMLKDPDWQVREGTLSGLGRIRNKSEVVVPLITPFLYDSNNILQRSAAYALRDLGSQAGYHALLQASNAPSSWPGIGDIIYEVQEKMQTGQSR